MTLCFVLPDSLMEQRLFNLEFINGNHQCELYIRFDYEGLNRQFEPNRENSVLLMNGMFTPLGAGVLDELFKSREPNSRVTMWCDSCKLIGTKKMDLSVIYADNTKENTFCYLLTAQGE